LEENARKDANQIINELKELIVSNSQSKVEQLEQELQQLLENKSQYTLEDYTLAKTALNDQIAAEKISNEFTHLRSLVKSLAVDR
jgi:F0F1-type ATP synthase membrane subunit b/b'